MNVERAKRLGWLVDTLELQYSQLNEILDEESKVLSLVPEGPLCAHIQARERLCCERLADALQNLGDAITTIMAARE